jgi:hypothetical protein
MNTAWGSGDVEMVSALAKAFRLCCSWIAVIVSASMGKSSGGCYNSRSVGTGF